MRVLSLSLLVLCVVLAVEARLPRKPSIHSSVKFVDPADAKDNQKISLIASDSSAAPIPWQGPSSVIGGALAHLMLGTMYCWGNFLSYSPQNLKFFDGLAHPGNQPDAIYVIPLTIISQSFSMPFGPLLTKTVGPAKATLIGCLISATAVYLASFQSSLALFMLTYSVMFGIGTGLAYTAPMSAGWKWMPNLKGLVSGGILAGFGTGGFIFSLIGSKIANPEALDMVDGKFPDEVYKRFPKMLRTLSMMYAAVATVGSFLVQEKPEEPAKGEKTLLSSDGATVTESTSSKQFWLMWMMMIASGTAGLNTAAVYKQFAISSPMLTGDTYQALVGGIGAMFNGVGRLFWGTFSDIVGFKKAFTLLTILQAALCLSYKLSTNSKLLFAANTCLLFFCLAGNLALMPPATQRMFGPKAGATVYGLLFSGFGIASVAGGILTKVVSKKYGWEVLFQILAAMSLLATGIVSAVKPLASYSGSTI